MTRKRGFTLIELMIAMSMMTVLIGAVTAVYAYTIQRLGTSLAAYTTQREAEYAMDTIDHIASVSQTCLRVQAGGNPCLKCILPSNCTDTSGIGMAYTCTPMIINKRSLERWGNGRRIWFYLSDSTGVPTNSGPILWMASRMDDSTPTSTDTVSAFTYYPGNSKSRVDLIQSFTTALGTYTNDNTIVVGSGSYTNADSVSPSTGAPADTLQSSISRTSYERGWRY